MTEIPAPRTFNVLEAVKGRNYPTDTVTIYTDSASMYQARHLEAKIADASDDEVEALEAQRAELIEKVKASGLTFTLKGLPPEIIDAIEQRTKAHFKVDEISDGEQGEYANKGYLSEMIVKVTAADGAEDTRHWTIEEVDVLKGNIPPEEWTRLFQKTVEVSFAALQFDSAVNVDFS